MPRTERLTLAVVDDTPPPSLWERVKEAVRAFTLPAISIRDPLLGDRLGGTPTYSGVAINEDTALTIAAVWDAVQVISGSIGSLPLHLYKRLEDGGKERMTWARVYRLLHDQPNPEMTAMVFRETLQAHALTWGNAYAEIERADNGEPLALWPLTPDRVTPTRSRVTGDLIYEVANTDGRRTILQADNVLHVPGLGFDGIKGYSVIQKARESLGLLTAAERFGARFFGSGARSKGVFTHPKTLSETARANLKNSLKELAPEDWAILEEGMTLVPWTIPPDDAQFLQTRQHSVLDVARWFNIPPHKIKDLSHATFTNVESQEISFVVGTLRPWCVRWEQELKRKLVRPLEQGQQLIEHNVDGLLRGDITSRYSAYGVGRQWGFINVNEIREKENLNPIGEQGDVYLMPVNMIPADKADQIMAPGATPAPRPAPAAEDDARVLQAAVETLRPDIARVEEAIRQAAANGQTAAAEAMQAGLTSLRAELAETQQALLTASDAQATERVEAVRQELSGALADVVTRTEAQASGQAERDAALLARLAEPVQAVGVAELAEQMRALAATQADAETLRADVEAAKVQAEGAAAVAQRALETAETPPEPPGPVVVAGLADLVAQIRSDTEAATSRQAAIVEAVDARLAQTEEKVKETVGELRKGAAETAGRVQERLRGLQVDAAQREQFRQTRASILAAHRRQIQDAMRRVLHREGMAARKVTASPEKFRAWMDAFYTRRQPMIDAVMPTVDMHTALTRSVEPAAARADALIAAHCQRSRGELEALLDSAPADLTASVEALTARWEQDRPGQVADQLMEEVGSHVE